MAFSFCLNLSLTDYDNPSATHILDAEVSNNLLIVSGMIGGIEFYDISNPSSLNHLSSHSLSSGGGGGGIKPNCVKVYENYAYVTSNQGVAIINISNPSNPENIGYIQGTSNLILENLDIYNGLLAIAAHEDGVLIYDLSNAMNPNYLHTIQTANSWTVKLDQDFVYVGDEQTLKMYYIHDNFSYYNSIEMTNSIKDIAIDDALLYVAVGSDGVVVYNTATNFTPSFIDSYNTSAMANRLAVLSGWPSKVAVSDWDDVEILELDIQQNLLKLVGYKNTTRRTMAVATKDNYIYSAEWASVQVFEFGEISGPDIDLSAYELNYPYVNSGDSYVLTVDVINNGNQILEILDSYTTNSEFEVLNPLSSLLPGEIQSVEVLYSADAFNASGSYRIFSNDDDEGQIICETNGNINGANIGQEAPNFNLNIVANGNGTFRLSDYIGSVVVLAFFAPN